MLNGYYMPKGMRPSNLEERRRFYSEEFNVNGVQEWLRGWGGKIVFAVIIGRHTRIYPPEYEGDASTTILIDKYRGLGDVRRWILKFLPESVYYDRNVYDDDENIVGQEMAFDLDPENLTCPIHGSLEDKMKRHQGLSFCEIELEMVKNETMRLHEELSKMFSDIGIVYSGRGFHIHVFDKDVFSWGKEKRREIAEEIKRRGFMIDEWVTSGSMRLIRLPYSLHGMVSRIVTPLDISRLEKFNPIEDEVCIPRFLKESLKAG
ncbi:DNA primase [Candidatus Bathyarchaeota archaeon]|nr:DNA primase [Candidatus Bathyarchaeota archaeon]